MTSKPAAINGFAGIRQRKVDRMPVQVVEQDGLSRHPQRLIHKADHLIRLQMMRKQ